MSLYYNGGNSFLHANGVKIYQFREKGSIKPYPLRLKNISKDFTVNNMKESGLTDMWMILCSF